MSRTKVSQGRFTVVLREEKEGGYSVQCIELPGAISEGETKKDALRNIKEAIQGYLEAFPEDAERLKLKNEVAEVSI
ncbi:MAG TPA: type II toxin-antitoxin system HicB family antitoxin [Candidatus Bathyarchaeia archaeon]|jgi:predicted RNase H-like HicB family nuclease|nr:type II toxin-antitoxin system HicB family antitoxin [Candidatus Bathyarchaeia archaeon]